MIVLNVVDAKSAFDSISPIGEFRLPTGTQNESKTGNLSN
jgi:hypothetical protein